MQRVTTLPAAVLPLVLVAAIAIALLPAHALSAEPCGGHQLLPKPRSEASCLNVRPQILVSPDKALRAVVLPVDVSLYATPDMESRVVIRNSKGNTLTSKDYSSPRGANGYYVHVAKWSPDSQFLVFSLVSSGGHSPWSFPITVYGRQNNRFAKFSDMIGGKPTVSGDFSFSGPHALVATTWKREGAPEDGVAVTVDLAAAFDKLPPSSE